MRHAKKKTLKISRRTLSLLMSLLMFAGMFAGVLSGAFSVFAKNPTHVGALNTDQNVQMIDLKPVAIGNTTWKDSSDGKTHSGASRTTHADSDATIDVEVLDNNDVVLTANQDVSVSSGETAYKSITTQVQQRINLAQNPFLMLSWEGDLRCNGFLGISLTINGTKYLVNSEATSGTNVLMECSKSDKITYKQYNKDGINFYSGFSFYNIYKGRFTNVNDTSDNDFYDYSSSDYTVELYAFLYNYLNTKFNNGTAWKAEYWPDWDDSDDNYLTVEFVNHSLISDLDTTQIYEGQYIKWKTCALGTAVMNPTDSLVPRCDTTLTNGYKSNNQTVFNGGRAKALDNGDYVFLNPSKTDKAVFTWNVERFVNVNELESLVFDAEYSHSNQSIAYSNTRNNTAFTVSSDKQNDFTLSMAVTGKNETSDGQTYTAAYQVKGFWAYLDTMIDRYSDCQDPTDVVKKYENVTINFHDIFSSDKPYSDVRHDVIDTDKDINNNKIYNGDAVTLPNNFVDVDQLVRVREIRLTLAPGAKLVIHSFGFTVENEYFAATSPDTVYPWSAEAQDEVIPVEGSFAATSNLNGNTAVAYDWIADSVPNAQKKFSLLHVAQKETSNITNSWRTANGESYITCNTVTDNFGYVRLASDGDFPIDFTKTRYLYYSYELTGTNAAVGVRLNFTDCDYFLAQTGLGLAKATSLMSSKALEQDPNGVYKSISSSASARTGVIDLNELNLGTKTLKNVYFYVTGQNAKLHFKYLFLGTATIVDASGISTEYKISVSDGDTFPWAVGGKDFLKYSVGTTYGRFVLANRFDVLDDMIDQANFHYRVVNYQNNNSGQGDNGTATVTMDDIRKTLTSNSDYRKFTYSYVERDDIKNYGSYEMKITLSGSDGAYQRIGGYDSGGYDDLIDFDLAAEGNLDKIRYLYYSVEADPGMRWTIVINDQHGNNVYRDWNGSVYGNANMTVTRDELGSSYNWVDITVPGSETGCIDLRDIGVNASFFTDGISSIKLVAYKDPLLKNADGTANAGGSVTFKYLHFGSEPLNTSSWGTMPVTTVAYSDNTTKLDKFYTWPSAKPQMYNIGKTISGASFKTTGTDKDSWATDFVHDGNYTPDYTASGTYWDDQYSLFFSFVFTDKDGNTAYPDYLIQFMESDSKYLTLHRGSTLGQPTFSVSTDINYQLKDRYKFNIPISGQIDIATIVGKGINKINKIRVIYDNVTYDVSVRYLFYGLHCSSYSGQDDDIVYTEKSLSQSGFNAQLDFVGNGFGYSTPNNDRISLTGNQPTDRFYTYTEIRDSTCQKSVDLAKTPYLCYSMNSTGNAAGTFVLDFSHNNVWHRYRRVGSVATATPSATLMKKNPSNYVISDDDYMSSSENGCVNLYQIMLDDGVITESDAKIWVGGVYYSVKNGVNSSAGIQFDYLFFDGEMEKNIDLLPSVAGGYLDDGTATKTMAAPTNTAARILHNPSTTPEEGETEVWDTWDPDATFTTVDGKMKLSSVEESVKVRLPGDVNKDNYNDLRLKSDTWSYTSIAYGALIEQNIVPFENTDYTYRYISTGNNQTSGMFIDLSVTPYLHFSISQPEDSYTSFLLQTNGYTDHNKLGEMSAGAVKPWISAYSTQSPAGQLIHVSPNYYNIAYYKDDLQEDNNGTWNSGNLAGVIDLRSWFTETNGYDNIISLERVRFYTNSYGDGSDVTVNHFYLSSSGASSYTVEFNNNPPVDEDGDQAFAQKTRIVHVLKNANKQYVSDDLVEGFKTETGYTFVGWYEDEDWEVYYDITSQPVTKNLILYAGWIKNDEVVKEKEVNLLLGATQAPDSVQTEGTGEWEVYDNSLHIKNTGDTEYQVKVPVNKAYSLLASRSLYIGFDTAKSMMTDNGESDDTQQTLKIEYELKSLGTHRYDVLGDAFGDYFTKDSGVLSAGPYDKELPLYMHLAALSLRPDLIKENKAEGYVVAKSIIFTVPAGGAAHIRYATAAPQLDSSNLEVVAPQITGDILDMLDPGDDVYFVEQENAVEYGKPETKTEIYGRTSTPTELVQTTAHSPSSGYISLGGKYGLGDHIGSFDIYDSTSQNYIDKYLYFAVDQPEESSTTFALYAMITYYSPSDGENHSSWASKFLTFYDYSLYEESLKNEDVLPLGSNKDLDGGNMPSDAYFKGSHTGYINLTKWYKTALADEVKAQEGDYVVSIRIDGIRIYAGQSGCEATYKYLAIGGPDGLLTAGNQPAKVIYTDENGNQASTAISNVSYGQTVRVSLDQLEDCADASDPSKQFLGWSFNNNDIVYWNPNAKNAKQYSSSNPHGAWSTSEEAGFTRNRSDIAYQLTTSTNKLYPMFGSAKTSTFSVELSGSGSVNVLLDNTSTARSISANTDYTVNYGSSVVLSTASTSGFIGWYNANNELLSTSRDYICRVYDDCKVIAKFGSTVVKLDPFVMGDSSSNIWLQAWQGDEFQLGKADSAFKLKSVNGGALMYTDPSEHVGDVYLSNINDTTGSDEIACYWSLVDGQMVEAVAPDGYHWELYLQDGTTVSLGESTTYRFVTSSDMKLICTPNAKSSDVTAAVLVNEYAVAFDRSTESHNATVSGQAFVGADEQIVSCGVVMASRMSGVQAPSFGSSESSAFAASAWNSSTGQYVVSVDFTRGDLQYLRGYAIVQNMQTEEYSLRYSDYLTISF